MLSETEQIDSLREYDEQIAECDCNVAQIKQDIASGEGVSGKDWRAAGEVMGQLIDAIECGDLKKQTRTAHKLAGILARTHTVNELRESLRKWQGNRRQWVDLRQRAERSLARDKRKNEGVGWLVDYDDPLMQTTY